MTAPKRVEVSWVDSCSNKASWSCDDDAKQWGANGAICRSIGFLVQRIRTGITLAMTYNVTNDEVTWGGLWFIPAGCVTKVRGIR